MVQVTWVEDSQCGDMLPAVHLHDLLGVASAGPHGEACVALLLVGLHALGSAC
jgi:hypothetical protein